MREKTIEQKLVKIVKSNGGLAPKFVSPGFDGMPDRIILLPGGKLGFVEVKAAGKTLRPLQVRRKEQLENLGFCHFVLVDEIQIKHIIDSILDGGDA